MDLITLGESLIDLPSTQTGVGLADAPGFVKVPAGAPANVAVAGARLGLQTGFISKVGDDPFGAAIQSAFAGKGVDTSRIIKDPAARTGLAFVSVMPDGSRDFLFYFDPARDLALRREELDEEYLRGARAFHYGSISLIAEPGRSATLQAARLARQGGALVSYDPNLRPRLWPDEASMRAQALAGFAEADIAKVSLEEIDFFYPDPVAGRGSIDRAVGGAGRLFEAFERLQIVAVTDGEHGSLACARQSRSFWHAPSFPVDYKDGTGAGDAFAAGLIFALLQQGPDLAGTFRYPDSYLKQALRFANACGALATTTLGAGMEALTRDAAETLAR